VFVSALSIIVKYLETFIFRKLDQPKSIRLVN
jgi:hypothetical protein